MAAEVMEWTTANGWFGKGTTATLVDLQTGISCSIWRWGGVRHADIVPNTAADYAAFRQIPYDTHYTPRPGHFIKDGRTIAVSFHTTFHTSKPTRNGHSGHVCLYFLNSTGHKEKDPDKGHNPAHKANVLKAAGLSSNAVMSGGANFPASPATYEYLKKYCNYMYNMLNASATATSVTLISSPWLRPGFSVWLDPLGISRFYYINTVRHSGNSRGELYTSLGLSYGRSEEEWMADYKKIESTKEKCNPFTFINHIDSKEYFLPESDDPHAVITPDNMGKKDYTTDPKGEYANQPGTFRNNLRSIQKQCDVNIAMNAYETPYRDLYGKYFVRRNTAFLNRYDSEYNLFELMGMMAAVYKDDTATAEKALSYPIQGPMNPIKEDNKVVSEIARKAIEWDLEKVPTPDIIKERANKTRGLVERAQEELAGRYDKNWVTAF